MTAHDDLDRQLSDFLREGPTALPDQSFDAVRDRTEQARQRVIIGPWRTPVMNRITGFGFAAAAVVAAVLIGSRLIGWPSGGFGTQATPTPEPTAAWVGLPAGPHLLSEGTDGGVPITVTIASPRWNAEANGDGLCWRDPAATCAGPPDGAGVVAFQGREYHVYSDACHRDPGPRFDTTATTVDELVGAVLNQVHRYASDEPEAITVDGYAGKKIVLYSQDLGWRWDCDDGIFALFGLPGDDPARYSQSSGQIDELWVVDVDGQIVVLDGVYYPDTSRTVVDGNPGTMPSVVDEVRAILASATFELP